MVHVRLGEGGLDDELLGAEERSEVCVEVLLLPARLAAGRRPEVHRVCRDLHKHQARRTGGDEGHGEENDAARVLDAEQAPPCEEPL